MTRALLSIGSNMGDRLGNLRRAVRGFGDAVIRVSPLYETPAWPPGDKAPKYLNAVMLVEDDAKDAFDWLKAAQTIEQPAVERARNPAWQFPARTLDVDVIMVWNAAGHPVLSDDPKLTLPHPRAYMRAFVLKPWHDIEPNAELPGHDTVADLLKTDAIGNDAAAIRQITDVL